MAAGGAGSGPATSVAARVVPGLAVAVAGWAVAVGVHALVPAVPVLTVCVLVGLVVGQVPALRPALGGVLAPGLAVSSRRLLRVGVVLLGLQLSLAEVAALGAPVVAAVLGVLVATFGVTLLLGRWARLPGDQPVLLAAGFSICGASAIGAMGAVTRDRGRDAATPVALVTLFGTLAIVVLPVVGGLLGLTASQFGAWAGSSVHDVGQVVATAGTAGGAALAVAVVVKLTRVLALAPMVALVAAVTRRRGGADDVTAGARPPLVPLFVAGFVVLVLVRSFLPVPESVVAATGAVQSALLGLALVALGTAVRVAALVRQDSRAVLVGLASWAFVAVASFGVVALVPSN